MKCSLDGLSCDPNLFGRANPSAYTGMDERTVGGVRTVTFQFGDGTLEMLMLSEIYREIFL